MSKLIMVVEDEKDYADRIAELLKDNGYEVITTYSAKEALEQLEKNKRIGGIFKNRIQCIILDIKMPEMDGLEFLKKLRKDYQEKIGVLILSAWEDEEKWDKAEKGLVINYIKKPVDKDNLLSEVKRFFNGYGDMMVAQARFMLMGKTSKTRIDKQHDPKATRERILNEMIANGEIDEWEKQTIIDFDDNFEERIKRLESFFLDLGI